MKSITYLTSLLLAATSVTAAPYGLHLHGDHSLNMRPHGHPTYINDASPMRLPRAMESPRALGPGLGLSTPETAVVQRRKTIEEIHSRITLAARKHKEWAAREEKERQKREQEREEQEGLSCGGGQEQQPETMQSHVAWHKARARRVRADRSNL